MPDDRVRFICPAGHTKLVDKVFNVRILIMECSQCGKRVEFKREVADGR